MLNLVSIKYAEAKNKQFKDRAARGKDRRAYLKKQMNKMKRRSNSHTYKLTYTDEARDIHRAVIESYLPFTEEFYPERSKPKDMLKLQEEKFS